MAPGVTFENGRLSFASNSEFLTLISNLKKMSESERVAWDTQLGHKSMQGFYNTHEGLVDGNSNPVYKTEAGDKPYIPDVLFAHILNEDGLYQVGGKVHRVCAGQELVTDKSAESLLFSLKSDPQVTHYKTSVEIYGPSQTNKTSNSRRGPDIPVAVANFDENHRAVVLFSSSSWFIYHSFAAKMEMKEWRGWWIFKSWQPVKATRLSIDRVGFSLPNVLLLQLDPFYGTGTVACNECSEAYAFIAEGWGIPSPIDAGLVFKGNGSATYNGRKIPVGW